MPQEEPLLELRRITKSFPGVKALSQVDLTVRTGEIHALMGENGAGKSTLIKVLTGVYRRDSGQMFLRAQPIDPRSTQEAQALGISTVYQEVNLIPHLSVAENITLGRQPAKMGCLDWKAINRRAQTALARLGLELDVTKPLSVYSVAVQQLAAIARALDTSAKLLVLDEPTSSLDAREVDQLFSVLRKLKSAGLGMIIVTHFLDQVYAIADRITVLRNGERVGEFEAASLPRIELIAKMLGKALQELETLPKSGLAPNRQPRLAPFLKVQALGKRGSIAPFDLEVARGEVLGLAGLLGSGRTETARLLFGLDRADSGCMLLDGAPVQISSARQAIRCRFGFCPEDRKTEGIIPHLSVRENIILALQAGKGWLRSLSRKRQAEIAGNYIRALMIGTPDAERPIQFLSGGNQQKAILARWLAADPRFLILDEPTRGIDVGARVEIEKLTKNLAMEGLSILFISSEIEEIVRTSDRVVVLRDRAKVAELAGEQISESGIMHSIAAPPL
jgi:monosaccharide-transporting ATPase